jgi:predicted O-methyltransferase YrrM
MRDDILISDVAQFQDDIDDYIRAHIDPEGDYLHRLYRATNLHLLYSRMASGHLQGRILKMLVEMVKPRLVLEVGTYSGYSALCMAEGLPEGGHLHTIEINDEQEDFTRPWLEGSPYADMITMHIGDALEVIPRLGLEFDMAFIDADKRHYLAYYELVLGHLTPGGYILADNTLWDGHVLQTEPTDPQTRSIREFNDVVARDSRVEKVILPLRDGLTIIKKL